MDYEQLFVLYNTETYKDKSHKNIFCRQRDKVSQSKYFNLGDFSECLSVKQQWVDNSPNDTSFRVNTMT